MIEKTYKDYVKPLSLLLPQLPQRKISKILNHITKQTKTNSNYMNHQHLHSFHLYPRINRRKRKPYINTGQYI